MNKKHTHYNIKKALKLAEKLFADNVQKIEHDLSENDHLLYIRIDLKEKRKKEEIYLILETFKKEAEKFLPSLFYDPTGKIEDYGWMIDVYYNNWPVDVMIPDIIIT